MPDRSPSEWSRNRNLITPAGRPPGRQKAVARPLPTAWTRWAGEPVVSAKGLGRRPGRRSE